MQLGGDNIVGLISYMRTDSTTLSKECLDDVQKYIKSNHPAFATSEERKYTKKLKNAQEAHEAIRPTSIENTPEKVKKYLEDQEHKLYELIWKRTVASQMTDAVYNQVTFEFNLEEI